MQFAVEEALMEKLDRQERELERKAARERATRDAERRVHEENVRRRQGMT